MKLVVDANILFAALIKEGLTKELLFRDTFMFFTSEFVFDEFEKYKDELLQKTKRTDGEFFQLIGVLKRRMQVVPEAETQSYLKRAQKISPDPKDVPYVAAALKLHAAIWSNDKQLKNKQDVIKVYSTTDVEKL